MLPKQYRLRLDKDIKALFAKGKGVFDVVVGAKVRKNDRKVSRFAVVVGVKVSKSAVVRNRIRRQIRAMIHNHLEDLAPGFDVMILVRPEAVNKKREEIESHLVNTLKKAKLL